MRSNILITALLCACAGPTESVWSTRVLGALDVDHEMGREDPVVRLPESARAGVSFQVEVVTYGSSSCTRADGAEVAIQGLLAAEITPYDRLRSDIGCTPDMHPFPRLVTLQFMSVGTALLRIKGRSLGGEPVEYEVSLPISP